MKYVLKIWLATITVSPIILGLRLGVVELDSFINLLGIMVVVGCLCSAPTFAGLFILTTWLTKQQENVSTIKTFATIVAVIGVIASFLVLPFEPASFSAPFIYAAVMTSSIWYFELPDNYIHENNE